ncbi:TPA: hypothetical protein QHR84_000979 [Escherichia coli]|nr:hypothetical protein [Escherichia coli]
MHVQPISTFRLFQEGHLLRNSIAIFVLTADTCLYRSKKDGRNRTSTMRYGEEVV